MATFSLEELSTPDSPVDSDKGGHRHDDGRASAFDALVARADAASANHAAVVASVSGKTPRTRRGVVVNYTMSAEDRNFIRRVAADHGLNASAFVRLACREYAASQGWS